MKAWTYESRGPPSQVLKLRHDIPQLQSSKLKANEVIVKISHVSLFGPLAQLMAVIPHLNNNPWIPDYEFSGTIAGAGAESTLREGDAVFGMIAPKLFLQYNGVLAEYAVVPLEYVVPKPDSSLFEEAAGLSGGGVTAIGIAERSDLLKVVYIDKQPRIHSKAEGKRVLVTGGSTGTGLVILQLIRYLIGPSGTLVTTASPRNHDTVLKYGADKVINYKEHPQLHKHLAQNYHSTPFDVIIDISGTDPNLYPNSPTYLQSNGTFVFAGNMALTHTQAGTGTLSTLSFLFDLVRGVAGWAISSTLPVVLGGIPRRSFFHSGQPTWRNLELVRQLVEGGYVKGVVDSVWEREDALKAYEHVARGRVCGKVVVKMTD
ncbi:zinc ion binding [Lithohypha guttulata]|uniref:Zinc ion binding n=1 Tax=Lithohypha guttulata TaxID=1690604 RepID=A0AAN7YAN7_9EURO|nr:zinc ion binding [Lithohypha guttulata]